jgi:hypothetical protein
LADAERLTMVRMEDWRGQNSNAAPTAIRPGFLRYLENLTAEKPGELAGRRGNVPVDFANDAADSAYDILSMMRLHVPEANWILYQDSNGQIKAGRDPGV